MKIKISIVEDDDGIRDGLEAMITRAKDFQFIDGFNNAESALALIPVRLPDVVLMDIHLPGMNGIECVKKLKTIIPSIQVLMLTVYEDNDSLFESLKAGASGYLLKRNVQNRLAESIREVYEGGAPFSPQIARRVIDFISKTGDRKPTPYKRTPSEYKFLDALAKGYAYKEIADKLQISYGTVCSYVRNVYQKLHVHSRTEAVVKYLKSQERVGNVKSE